MDAPDRLGETCAARRALLRSTGLFATAALLGACRREAPSSATPAPRSDGAYAPITIRYSDPGNGGTTSGVYAYAKRERIFEQALAAVNAKIEWVPGPQAFSANFDAMNTGAVTAAGGAISPIVGALAHNLPFRIFAISDPAAVKQEGIIVPKGSPIRSIKELVGKRVAVNLAAHGDYMLLKALANEGVPASSVERVPIQPPDAAGAFATGKIDAWSTFGVFFNTAVRNGARVLKYGSQLGSDDVTVVAANVKILEQNPAAFQVFIKTVQRLVEESHRTPEKFQNVFTDKGPTAIAGDELKLAIEAARTLPMPRVPTAADRARVANVVKILFENKSIDRSIPVDDIVFDVDAAAAARKVSVR